MLTFIPVFHKDLKDYLNLIGLKEKGNKCKGIYNYSRYLILLFPKKKSFVIFTSKFCLKFTEN